MTSVGYGDLVAVTPIGRGITILATILGALYLALMVALVTGWLTLDQKQALAMHKVKDQIKCGKSIVAALRYNTARQKRYRMINEGLEYSRGCPSSEDVRRLKDELHRLTKHRADCPEKQQLLQVARQEKRLDTL